MLVKICGLMDPEMAHHCAKAGADFIGILFSSKSPRKVTIEQARTIVEATRKGGAEPVGVFVDESLDEMMQIIQTLQLKTIQLHGDHSRKNISQIPKEIAIIYVVNTELLPNELDPNKDFLLFERSEIKTRDFRFFIAGGLNRHNLTKRIHEFYPDGVDVSSGVESNPTQKDLRLVQEFIDLSRGRYGEFGGMYVPELLVQPLKELEIAFETIACSDSFQKELAHILNVYAGRPTPLTEVKRFAARVGKVRIFLKREDLLHTGAHKINNALGQCLLAKKMGKNRIIAETGAGQHGVATATACALLGLQCTIFMGSIDIERQAPNVAKMKILGATVVSIDNGTLKEAINSALRDWAETYETTHYCLGSALGPHPFPRMVAAFQRVIGKEAKVQLFHEIGRNPDYVVACVGGGSNAIGIFSAYLDDKNVQLIGVEAGGNGKNLGQHAARFRGGAPGVLHGSYTYILQTKDRQIAPTHSISAGLDYPAVGPEHSNLFQSGRAKYEIATDSEALMAFQLLSQMEGIIPALESSHALAYAMRLAKTADEDTVVLVNLSGRGDKDLEAIAKL